MKPHNKIDQCNSWSLSKLNSIGDCPRGFPLGRPVGDWPRGLP